jgi:hypothetical protein
MYTILSYIKYEKMFKNVIGIRNNINVIQL